MRWMSVGAPPYHPSDRELVSAIESVVDQFAFLRGRLEKLYWDLEPYIDVLPGSESVYGFPIATVPEPGSLAADIVKWGARSVGHQEAVRQFRQSLVDGIRSLKNFWSFWNQEISTILDQLPPLGLDRRYKEAELRGYLEPPTEGDYAIQRADREAQLLLRQWESIGYQLNRVSDLLPEWEAWNDTRGVDDIAEKLEELFLIQIPPQKRLQSRDWLYY